MDATKRCESTARVSGNLPEIELSELVYFSPKWERFLSSHGKWFEQRLAENEPVFALPRHMLDHRASSLFQILDADLVAEQCFAELCKTFLSVGICSDQPLPYRWLRPRIGIVSDDFLTEMKPLGWTDEHIDQYKTGSDKADDLAERLKGSVGRLVCSPLFCKRRDELRKKWQKLPLDKRPRLPLSRSPKLSSSGNRMFSREVPPRNLIKFVREFDRFCDEWRLNGMTAWELPDVDGPKWPAECLSSQRQLSGQFVWDTPWHFCVLAKDGLGEAQRLEHALVAKERGVNDHGKWQTYSHLFEIGFWENVTRIRYKRQQRARAFVTAQEQFIADIVNLDPERVQKLRKMRVALLSGKITSLAGKR